MAIIRNNILVENLRGMIGDQLVFRRLRGKTVVSHKPGAPGTQSEKQRENRRRFRHATKYAKFVLNDPAKKAYYQQKARKLNLPNAYTAAITDYMRRPVIKAVTTAARRKDGCRIIKVTATKRDFAMGNVEIMIKNALGQVVERGAATRKEAASPHWHYQPAIMLTEDLSINVIATDRPGNKDVRVTI